MPLYERGYEKDPAKVAAEAIRVAQRDGRDVVLVDTAGRMQVNSAARLCLPCCLLLLACAAHLGIHCSMCCLAWRCAVLAAMAAEFCV